MLFDDRLATVLRSGTAGEQAARTQYRQLLDLLGSTPPDADSPLVEAAYRRLAEIAEALPAADQSRIVREPWLRLRNPRLVAHLAAGDPQAAAAAMATARLEEHQWLELIPRLPVTARGFLRHRRDLPQGPQRLLARLGVRDLVLPQPQGLEADPEAQAAPEPGTEAISALVKRIEAFQQARKGSPAQLSPRLPLEGGAPEPAGEHGAACDFSTGPDGRIDWAEGAFGPLLVGIALTSEERLDSGTLAALRAHQPVRGGHLRLLGVPAIAGEWRVDAAPRFSPAGAFAGYLGRLRRPNLALPAKSASPAADRMRQVLHELRTPVGAIQGFAEIIQQQLFGAAPNAYRALAAAVGVDAARLLAGFDEIDRMVKLEGGALELSDEGANLRLAVERTLKRLEGATRPRSARIRLLVSGESFAVALGEDDTALLVWRVLATLAGALAPGEIIESTLSGRTDVVELRAELPIGLASVEDPFASGVPAQTPAVTAGMFGTGFTLRLARAEAEAAGGGLTIAEEGLILTLPALTGARTAHSHSAGYASREGSG